MLFESIFVECGGPFFQQSVGIPMGTNQKSFRDSCEITKKKILVRSFNFIFRYIDDVLSLNNQHLDIIYPVELELRRLKTQQNIRFISRN